MLMRRINETVGPNLSDFRHVTDVGLGLIPAGLISGALAVIWLRAD